MVDPAVAGRRSWSLTILFLVCDFFFIFYFSSSFILTFSSLLNSYLSSSSTITATASRGANQTSSGATRCCRRHGRRKAARKGREKTPRENSELRRLSRWERIRVGSDSNHQSPLIFDDFPSPPPFFLQICFQWFIICRCSLSLGI